MRSKILPEHFVAFLTVCGFFLGLIFCVLSIEKAFDIIVFTILITFLFYMCSHISIMFFIDKDTPVGKKFNVEEHEAINDILIMDLEKKEGKSEHILKAIEMEREELKKSEVKEKRRKDGSKNAA